MTDTYDPPAVTDEVDTTVRPEDVFTEMTARKAHLEERIKVQQAAAKHAYAAIADLRVELRIVNRLLSAAKPRNRTKKGK